MNSGGRDEENKKQETRNAERTNPRDQRPGRDIAERLLKLGAGAFRASRSFPRDAAARHVALQLVRSATSAGANYGEARGAESRADFAHKCAISVKELRETQYWLGLVELVGLSRDPVAGLLNEVNELIAVLVTSIRTARARA